MSQNYAWDYRTSPLAPKVESTPSPEEIIANHEARQALKAGKESYRALLAQARKDPDLLLVVRAREWAKAGAEIIWRPNMATAQFDPVGVPDGFPPGVDGEKIMAEHFPE